MKRAAQLKKEIKTIICEITDIPVEELEDDANLVDDIGIMSIMAVDILNSIQKKYKLEIPEEMFGEFDCLDSIVELVQKLLEDKVKTKSCI
jgi:acyl carrier protein